MLTDVRAFNVYDDFNNVTPHNKNQSEKIQALWLVRVLNKFMTKIGRAAKNSEASSRKYSNTFVQ